METHKVLDLHYLHEAGQECFRGTKEECENFFQKQTPYFMYEIVQMTKMEIETHSDNNHIKMNHN